MTTAPGLRFDVRPLQAMHASPDLVTYAQLLLLSSQELEARVEVELVANPALVREELWSCPTCGAERTTEHCGECLISRAPLPTAPSTWSSHAAAADAATTRDHDPAEQRTSAARLIEDARLLLPSEDRPLVEWLVGSLDGDGFLRTTVADLAGTIGVSSERLDRALGALRVAGPAAVGARDLRECLLLQLALLEPAPMAGLAMVIVREHLENLGRGHVAGIATALGVRRKDIVDARDFIRRYLEPRPMPGLHQALATTSPRVRPDIVINPSVDAPSGLSVEVVTPARATIRVDPLYLAVARPSSQPDPVPAEPSPEDRRRVVEQVNHASAFVARLRDRERTLERIARLVVDRQTAFVRFGPQFVLPLTRVEIANELGVHESTVSRAVAHKFVQMPTGKVVPFGDFFDTTLAVQAVLRAVLESEDRPMSDADLTEGLRARGYRLARRTVAKYRQRLGIPVAGIRESRPGRWDESRRAAMPRERVFA